MNRVTKLAPQAVRQCDVPCVISLQNSIAPRRPKFQAGQKVRIKRKIETFHRGYRIQFTKELFTITAIQTLTPTYTIEDTNNQLILGKFNESELTKFDDSL